MAAPADEPTDLSKQYDTPLGLAHTTMQALKDRIKQHYDLASDYYLSLWCVSGRSPNSPLTVPDPKPGASTSTTATGRRPSPRPPSLRRWRK